MPHIIKYRSFWAPTIIAYAVFMWGAAIGHIYNIQQTGNLAQETPEQFFI
jgi:hypothetical protein